MGFNKQGGAWLFFVVIIVILGAVLFLPNYLTGDSIDNKKSEILQGLVDKSIEIKTCSYDIQSLANTEQYDLESKKIDECRAKISKLRAEADTLILAEQDQDLKREYQALSLNYQASALSMDIEKNSVAILQGKVTKEQMKGKVESIKVLINEYLDTIDQLKLRYSDTYFYQNNYAIEDGKSELDKAKAFYEDVLAQYKDISLE